jgi:hypothetical protein
VLKVLVVTGAAGAVGLASMALFREFTHVWCRNCRQYHAPGRHADVPSWATARGKRNR